MAARSYVSVPMSVPYIYQSVPERLRLLAEQHPDREAFVFYDMDKKRSQLTRKEVWDQSVDIATRLMAIGLKKGSHVALCMNNSMEMLIANFGVQCSGGIPFYLRNLLTDGSDVVETMIRMNCDVLFIDSNPTTQNLIEQFRTDAGNVSELVPTVKAVIVNGDLPGETKRCFTFASFQRMTLEENAIVLPDVQPEDVMSYFCTSGSTGKPKMVVYTHFNMINWTKQCDYGFQITEKSRFFCDRTFGWVVGHPRTYFTEGTTRVFVDMRMSLSGKHIGFLSEIIERERCDIVYAPGYIMDDLQNNRNLAAHFSAVRTIIVAGERVTKRFTEMPGLFCQRACNFYGSTECGGTAIFTMNSRSSDFEEGIIGKPIAGTEIKITDEDGHVVPVGQSGNLYIRCAWRLVGYVDMDEQFQGDVDKRNWFNSGDVAHLRDDDQIVVEGRAKELISIGTTKIYPWDVERVLKQFPRAASIFAVGVPDKRLHQVVCACAVSPNGHTLNPKDIERFCEETFHEESTGLGIGMKPKYYLVLDYVPLTPSGKIDRRTIGLIAKEKLGL